MKCPFCEHSKAHKHGKTSKGSQRYRCPICGQTFTDTLDTLHYRRRVSPDVIERTLQAHAEGMSLRGISRQTSLAYDTVSSLLSAASEKVQMVHNASVNDVLTQEIAADEMWSFVKKKQKHCRDGEQSQGDCWIAISLDRQAGLILSARIGKHTDALLTELWVSTEGKTACKRWYTDGWEGYKRIFTEEINHTSSKKYTQKLERTNGVIRQQTGRWHRRQNKFSKQWERTKVTTRIVVGYFNWIWRHSRKKTTAAQRAELTDFAWRWDDIFTYPTLY
ncbi:MAG: IS1 family transposase [Cyanobacteria bacterium P01_F01_bin.86]